MARRCDGEDRPSSSFEGAAATFDSVHTRGRPRAKNSRLTLASTPASPSSGSCFGGRSLVRFVGGSEPIGAVEVDASGSREPVNSVTGSPNVFTIASSSAESSSFKFELAMKNSMAGRRALSESRVVRKRRSSSSAAVCRCPSSRAGSTLRESTNVYQAPHLLRTQDWTDVGFLRLVGALVQLEDIPRLTQAPHGRFCKRKTLSATHAA